MTMNDDLYDRLANVTEQLARERSRVDRLEKDNEILRADLRDTLQANMDLERHLDQLRERNEYAQR